MMAPARRGLMQVLPGHPLVDPRRDYQFAEFHSSVSKGLGFGGVSLVSVDIGLACVSICFKDPPGDVLAARASALWLERCDLSVTVKKREREITSVPASLAD